MVFNDFKGVLFICVICRIRLKVIEIDIFGNDGPEDPDISQKNFSFFFRILRIRSVLSEIPDLQKFHLVSVSVEDGEQDGSLLGVASLYPNPVVSVYEVLVQSCLNKVQS